MHLPLRDTVEYSKKPGFEIFLENSFEDTDDSKLLDFLEDLRITPLDLNTASAAELEQVPLISSLIAKNIILYRNKNKYFGFKRELLQVPGISEPLYGLIKDYVAVKKTASYTKIKNFNNTPAFRYRSRFQQDLQTKQGFLNKNYPGAKAKFFNQLSGLYNKKDYTIETNITIEKDAGETSLTDFYSGFIGLKNYGFIKRFILGDYSLEFGQGLGMWGSLGYSKGSLAVDAVKKRTVGISAYKSVNESQFFRGGAVNLNYKNLDFYLYYSGNYYDASYDTTLGTVSSFYFDGYHRTISERNRANSVREDLAGSRLNLTNAFGRFGITFWASKFSRPVAPDSIKQRYSFSGQKANMLSIDYDIIYNNTNIFGEFARSQTGSIAGLGAILFEFKNTAKVIFLYRFYPVDFSPVHSFGFGDMNGNTQNENGFYSGITLTPIPRLSINAYFDQFSSPYRTYFNPAPGGGTDLLVNVALKADNNLNLNFRYKNRNKEESRSVKDEYGRDVEIIDTRNMLNLRLGFEYRITKGFRLSSRLDYASVSYKNFGGNNKGLMFFTDADFGLLKDLSASVRLAFFDTDSYDSRIYVYEDDIPGVLSNVPLYGKGRRWYFVMNYKAFQNLSVYGKYSETYYDGAASIGTGNDLISGSINNRMNLGVELSF